MAQLLGELLAPLRYEALPTPPAQRRSEPVPASARDLYNAVVRWCEVRGSGEGPLAGLRVSVKDSVSVAGVPLGCGSALLEGYVPERDSAVLARILSQGGEVVAITNMDDLAASADGSSSFYGPTLNPFDRERLAGGSSGGAAASLYLDGIDAAIGTDQGGSARVPASWCGVVGFKPSRDAIPYTGVVGTDQLLDHVGILAAEVEVVARVFAAVADSEGSPAEPAPSLPDLRLGLLTESLDPGLGTEPAVAEAVSALAAALGGAGAGVESISVPEHLETAAIETALSVEGLTSLLHGRAGAYGWESRSWPSVAAALQAGFGSRAERLSPQVKAALLIGNWLDECFGGVHYVEARRRCAEIAAAYDRALDRVDALIMPATPFTAPDRSPAATVGEAVIRGWSPMANTAQFNLSGHPAISLPLCEVGGLPLGMMLVGRRGEDARLLAVSRALEGALGRRPEAPPPPP